MPYMNDAEFQAQLARIVEKILRTRPTDNYYVGYGRVSEAFAGRDRKGTSAGASPAASIDGNTVGGDLSGVLPNPKVDGLQGRAVGTAAPSDTQVLTWNASASEWRPGDVASLDSVESAGFTKELLMQDGVTAPPVPVETEAQDDWLYQD